MTTQQATQQATQAEEPPIIILIHPTIGARKMERYTPPRAGKPGVIWCPFCDTSFQDSKVYPACTNNLCRAGKQTMTAKEFDRMVNPPLEDRLAVERAKALSAAEQGEASIRALEALEKEAMDTDQAHLLVGPSPVDGEGNGDGTAEKPLEWRYPIPSDKIIDEGRVVHIPCGKNYHHGPGPMASHGKSCNASSPSGSPSNG